MYYVCDACGNLTQREQVPEGEDWTCEQPGCGSHAAWEYDRKDSAEIQARRIRDIERSGLFKRA